MNTMPISELIEQVTEICKKNGVKRLDLFGSFATDAKRNIMWNSYLKKLKFKEPLTFQEVWTYITQGLKQCMEK